MNAVSLCHKFSKHKLKQVTHTKNLVHHSKIAYVKEEERTLKAVKEK